MEKDWWWAINTLLSYPIDWKRYLMQGPMTTSSMQPRCPLQCLTQMQTVGTKDIFVYVCVWITERKKKEPKVPSSIRFYGSTITQNNKIESPEK